MTTFKSLLFLLVLYSINVHVWAITVDMQTACTAQSVPLQNCDVTALTHDFNDAIELSSWQQRNVVESSLPQINLLDMNNTSIGDLAFSPTQGYWYFQNVGPLLFKLIDTDFILTTSLNAASTANNSLGSNLDFNSGGLMIRDPASGGGNQNYVMFDIGNQQTGQGSLTRNTVNSVTNYTYQAGTFSGLLRLCRVGSTISLWRQLATDGNWILANTYERADFPAEVQVGLAVNAYQGPSDMTVLFDYVDFQVPTAGNDCTSAPDLVTTTELIADTGFSDEFNSNSLSDWSLLHLIEARPPQYSELEINQLSNGQLSIIPTNDAWYFAGDAPFVFKTVSGNFVVETTVTANGVNNPVAGPLSDYNNAGLMIRDPDTVAENWVMLDIGRQSAELATMSKVTRDSISTLQTQVSGTTASLRICRINNTYNFYRRLPGETQWTNVDSITHNTISNTVQVGMISNAWVAPADIRAEFDYVHLAPVNTISDCTLPIYNNDLAFLSDEFNSASTLVDWSIRSIVENDVLHYDQIEIDNLTNGYLTIDANTYVQPFLSDFASGPGWYQDRKGPYVFKEVSGDFSVMTYVRVGTVLDIFANPGGTFQAGGILVRDPASYNPVFPDLLGNENWIVYNIGNQIAGFATELKTTFSDGADVNADSDSTMFFTPVSSIHSRLILCRVGDRFRFFRNSEELNGTWNEELITVEPYLNGAGLIPPYYNGTGFTRPDLSMTLQVGVMANRYYANSPAIRTEYDYLRFARPTSEEDCVNSVTSNY